MLHHCGDQCGQRLPPSLCLEDILNELAPRLLRRCLESLHLTERKPPSHRTQAVLCLRQALCTGDRHRSLAHAPVDGNLKSGEGFGFRPPLHMHSRWLQPEGSSSSSSSSSSEHSTLRIKTTKSKDSDCTLGRHGPSVSFAILDSFPGLCDATARTFQFNESMRDWVVSGEYPKP